MKRKVKSKEALLEYFDEIGAYEYGGVWEHSSWEFGFSENTFPLCSKTVNVAEEDGVYTMQEPPHHSFIEEWLEPLETTEELHTVCCGDFCVDVKPLKSFADMGTTTDTETYRTTSLEEISIKSEFTDKHYDFTYKLTEEDIEKGEIRIDAYFVTALWKLFERDGGSGILFHCLKTILRIGKKAGNTYEREVTAIKKQLDNLERFL